MESCDNSPDEMIRAVLFYRKRQLNEQNSVIHAAIVRRKGTYIIADGGHGIEVMPIF